MAIDKLQDKIRKMKNPLVMNLSVPPEHIPTAIRENTENFLKGYKVYVTQLLDGLKSTVPAVRFDLGMFVMHGAEGLQTLFDLLQHAKTAGYYTFLEGMESLSAASAAYNAQVLFGTDSSWCFDGLITTAYIGSDGIIPYIALMKESNKDLFLVTRTANRSAAETQDLLTGSRLAHVAKADIANRYASQLVGRSGYSRVALMASASSADSLRTLRSKYTNLFLLLDGCDYPNANAKNCSYAFDRLGHGAIACAGYAVSGAWMNEPDDTDPVEAALHAAERLKKNLTRYVTVL
jgi:orotidine-5'-phosphate decarboxylase